jgi:hypothetical protein
MKRFTFKNLNQYGAHHIIIPAVAFVLLFAIAGTYMLVRPHAAPTYYLEKLTSVGGDLCLDNSSTSGNIITWTCSPTDSRQGWQLMPSGSNWMLKNQLDGTCINDPGTNVKTSAGTWQGVSSHICDGSTGVVWRNYGGAWLNPASHYNGTNGCLNDPGSSTSQGHQLIMYPCNGTGLTTFSSVQIGGTTAGGSGGSCPIYSGSSTPAQAQAEAKCLLPKFGWSASTQWSPLLSLWNQESSWNYRAVNPTTGACGIPQSLPCGKATYNVAAVDPNYFLSHTDSQINWGLNYIQGVYGSPSAAWAHEKAYNWYLTGRDPHTGRIVHR